MNYNRIFYASTAKFKDSYISFTLHEFLEPKRFFPRKNILQHCECGALTQTLITHNKNGIKYNRIQFYNKYAHYNLYFRVHEYRIPISPNIKATENSLQEYLPLIMQNVDSPYTSKEIKRYTNKPLEKDAAYSLIDESAKKFYFTLIISFLSKQKLIK